MERIHNTFGRGVGTASEMGKEASHGKHEEAVGDMFAFMESIPTSTYYFAMIGSILASLALFMSGKRWESLFVGLWAPTIITSSMFYKLLHPSHEMK